MHEELELTQFVEGTIYYVIDYIEENSVIQWCGFVETTDETPQQGSQYYTMGYAKDAEFTYYDGIFPIYDFYEISTEIHDNTVSTMTI